MTDHEIQLMMLDIDGVLTRYEATTTDVLAAAQQMAVSAIGDLVNAVSKREESQARLGYPEREQGRADRLNHVGGQSRGQAPGAKPSEPVPMTTLATLADAIAEQIRAALHARIDEGKLPEW